MWFGVFLGFGESFGRFWHFLSLVILSEFLQGGFGVFLSSFILSFGFFLHHFD